MINKYAEIAYRLRLIKAANFMFKQAMTRSEAEAFGKATGLSIPGQIGDMLDERGIPESNKPAAKPYAPPTSTPTAKDYEKMLAGRDEMWDSMIKRFDEERALNRGLIEQRDAKITALSKELGISKGQAAELQKQLDFQTGLANRYSKEIGYNIDRYNGAMNKNKALQYKLDNVTGRHQRATKTISDMKKLHAQQMGAMDDSLKHMTHQYAESQAARKALAQRAKYLKYGLIGTGATAAAMSIPAAYGAYSYFNN